MVALPVPDCVNRRRLLAGAAGLAAATSAGCLDGVSAPGRPDEPTADDPGAVPWEGTPPEWTRDTDCGGMHDSVVTVEWQAESLRDAYSPIHFSDLTEGEQAIVWTALRDGGYGTCDTEGPFDRFVRRVVESLDDQPDDGGIRAIPLEYRDRYYGLNVEKLDQVYAA